MAKGSSPTNLSSNGKQSYCQACGKRFAFNKRLVEHLDKSDPCKQFYITNDIVLPVTKTSTRSSKKLRHSMDTSEIEGSERSPDEGEGVIYTSTPETNRSFQLGYYDLFQLDHKDVCDHEI